MPLLLGLLTFTWGTLASVWGGVTVGDIQIGGFAGQGVLWTTENNQFGETENGSLDFREMAVNATAVVGPKLRVGAQGFAQRLGKYGEDKVMLDWAVADYNVSQQFGVRAGRVKLPRGLHNEALDLDATRPFILLPQSLYDARLRDFQAAFNGAMVYGSTDTKSGAFDYKAFYGDTPMRKRSGIADILTGGDGFVEGRFETELLELKLKSVYGGTLF